MRKQIYSKKQFILNDIYIGSLYFLKRKYDSDTRYYLLTTENKNAICAINIDFAPDQAGGQYIFYIKEQTWIDQENAFHYLGIIDNNRDPIYVFDSPQNFLDWLEKVTVESQYDKLVGEEE